MLHSRSAPGLGRDTDPQWRYPNALLLTLSPEEEEAERLYYAAISTSLTKGAFTILAKNLSRRSPAAANYLTWLIIYRGQLWPGVGGTIVNAKEST